MVAIWKDCLSSTMNCVIIKTRIACNDEWMASRKKKKKKWIWACTLLVFYFFKWRQCLSFNTHLTHVLLVLCLSFLCPGLCCMSVAQVTWSWMACEAVLQVGWLHLSYCYLTDQSDIGNSQSLAILSIKYKFTMLSMIATWFESYNVGQNVLRLQSCG